MDLVTGRNFSLLLVFVIFVVGYSKIRQLISRQKAGKELPKVRKLVAIDAIEEAIGRAAEMNKTVFWGLGSGYSGLQGQDSMAFFASLDILMYTARLTAKYGVKLFTAVWQKGESFALARERVREGYMVEGKADELDLESSVQLISPDNRSAWLKLGPAAVRSDPGAIIQIGPLGGPLPALILAEAGMRMGAMQVAGSNRINIIPYLGAMADYLVIGEEIFACEAYITGEASQVGSLAAEDMFKYSFMTLMILGAVALSLGSTIILDLLNI